MEAPCYWEMISCMKLDNLEVMIFDKILWITLQRLSGLKSFILVGSATLGTRKMYVSSITSGALSPTNKAIVAL